MRRAGAEAILLATATAGTWLVFDAGGLDVAVSRVFFDATTGAFPLKDHWWFAAAGHTGLKRLSIALWVGTVMAAAAAPARFAAWRAPLAEGALLSALCALFVLGLRGLSAHSCPWDLAGFGGQATHFPLGAPLPADPGPGRCLPAAHASSGFALFGLYIALRDFRPRVARGVLAFATSIGLVAGFVQLARGAHFPSHVLWTAWTCWAAAWAGHSAIASARRACSRSRGSRGS